MSLGILGQLGLGAWTSTIPGECWAQTGFKACNLEQYNIAKTKCQNIGQDNDDCIGPIADQMTIASCKCTRKTTSTTKPKTSTSPIVKPSDLETLEPVEPMLFGMDMKTVAMVGLAAVGLYVLTNKPKKKG